MTTELEHNHVDPEIADQPAEVTLVRVGRSETAKRKRYPEANLRDEWKIQTEDLARRFAGKLGFSREEYIQTLPKFVRRPINFKGENGIPVIPAIVETRIPLAQMLEIVGIFSLFDPQNIIDWEGGKSKTPDEPYATWLTYRPNKSVEETRTNLGKSERGALPFDGISLFLIRPLILNFYSLKLPGSQVGSENAPFLSALVNELKDRQPHHPTLHYGSIDKASPRYACLVASSIRI